MQAVIIAAGESSRFWPLNKQHKSQLKILGKSLLFWTLKILSSNGIKDVIVVGGAGSDIERDVTEECRDLEINSRFITQEKPLGTGNAIFQAKDLIREPFFVFWPYKINAGEIAQEMLKVVGSQSKGFVLTGTQTTTPWDYGIVRFENDKVVEIVENPKNGEAPSDVKILGSYFLRPDFFEYYQRLKKHHPEDFVDALNLYMKDSPAGLIVLEKDSSVLKYPWQALEISKEILKSERLEKYISPQASVAQNVVINGNVYIDDGAVVSENTVINGPCYIGKSCQIGAANILRGPVDLEAGVRTGAFCEIKNSIVQEGAHLHSGYVGDSIIGQNCRLGAGIATANRRLDRSNIKAAVKGDKIDTGLTYLGAIIGDNTKIGIHVSLMPGVLIGADCNIWPHSLVRENVEDGTTYRTELKVIKEKSIRK